MNLPPFICSLTVLFGVVYIATSAPHSNNNDGKKITELNSDVLSLIFENLLINEVLNVLEAYPDIKFIDAANNAVRKHSKKYWVEIDERYGPKRIQIEHSAKCIKTGEKAPILLKYIGRSLANIKIERSSKNITELVNDYACDSLIKLKLHYMNGNPLEGFEKPFKNLESLLISSIKPINATLPFDQLFPNLKKLTLQTKSDIDSYVVAQRIPTLVHLKLEKSEGNKNYLRMLERNPQIKSLKIDELTQEYCNVINDNVENLQNLSISTINADVGDEAVFENVKHLKADPHGKNFNLLTLPQLESLEMFHASKETPEWTAFYNKHQNVKRLKIGYNDGYVYRDLDQMTRKLPNLKEFILVKSKKWVTSESIIAVIEGNPNLEKVSCVMSYISFESMTAIQEKFENDWNIVVENSTNTDEVESFFLEKKN